MNRIIVFIGAGKMATAIAAGLVGNGYSEDQLHAYDISETATAKFTDSTRVKASNDSNSIPNATDIVIIAVKPQNIEDALTNLKERLQDKLLISIAAGVKINTIQSLTGNDRVIRVMPNTPALVGEGIAAYAVADGVSSDDADDAKAIFETVGHSCKVEEKHMDAVTGLSGSGPAYVFEFIQALADGGVHAGLSRDIAGKLAVQTVLGAAKMIMETDTHPVVLRDQVTSPAGTTAEGLAVLERKAFQAAVGEAVMAATERSRELGAE